MPKPAVVNPKTLGRGSDLEQVCDGCSDRFECKDSDGTVRVFGCSIYKDPTNVFSVRMGECARNQIKRYLPKQKVRVGQQKQKRK